MGEDFFNIQWLKASVDILNKQTNRGKTKVKNFKVYRKETERRKIWHEITCRTVTGLHSQKMVTKIKTTTAARKKENKERSKQIITIKKKQQQTNYCC